MIGAGPAGTACAIELTQAGNRVVVVDKAVFPRDKCCGDGLTASALRHLEQLGLDVPSLPGMRSTTEVRVHAPSGRTVELALPRDGMYAVVVPRVELDSALVAHSRSLGVDVREGCEVVSVAHDGADGVLVGMSDGSTSRWDHVVAADGMWSPTRKLLGLDEQGYLGEWHAFRQYASNITGPAADELHVWFEEDLLPGYAWSFPLPGNRANVGFGMLRDARTSGKQMAAKWRDLLARPHIRAALGETFEMEGRHTAWPIPARVDRAVRSSGRVLFVGDAVCATDLLTGEGIGQALETGRLAAQAISEGRTPADVRARYSELLDSHFLADHRMSAFLGRLLAGRRVTEAVLRTVDTNDWTRRNFVRWMFEDEPRAVVLTPRRWHRRFLSRPGAFTGRTPQ